MIQYRTTFTSIVFANLLIFLPFGVSFITQSVSSSQRHITELNVHGRDQKITRKSFLSITTAATFLPLIQPSHAEVGILSEASQLSDDWQQIQPKNNFREIEGCPKPTPGKPNNCVATSNIKQLENYSPPWIFEGSSDEAFARLKGLVKSEPTFKIIEMDDEGKYMKIDVQRLNTQDEIEFIVRGDDKIVLFKSFEKDGGTGLSDFGTNKKRVDGLRLKSGGFFNLQGEGLTADSFDGGSFGKRYGVTSQLKAFYGLQSGKGFEEVFEE